MEGGQHLLAPIKVQNSAVSVFYKADINGSESTSSQRRLKQPKFHRALVTININATLSKQHRSFLLKIKKGTGETF